MHLEESRAPGLALEGEAGTFGGASPCPATGAIPAAHWGHASSQGQGVSFHVFETNQEQ